MPPHTSHYEFEHYLFIYYAWMKWEGNSKKQVQKWAPFPTCVEKSSSVLDTVPEPSLWTHHWPGQQPADSAQTSEHTEGETNGEWNWTKWRHILRVIKKKNHENLTIVNDFVCDWNQRLSHLEDDGRKGGLVVSILVCLRLGLLHPVFLICLQGLTQPASDVGLRKVEKQILYKSLIYYYTVLLRTWQHTSE